MCCNYLHTCARSKIVRMLRFNKERIYSVHFHKFCHFQENITHTLSLGIPDRHSFEDSKSNYDKNKRCWRKDTFLNPVEKGLVVTANNFHVAENVTDLLWGQHFLERFQESIYENIKILYIFPLGGEDFLRNFISSVSTMDSKYVRFVRKTEDTFELHGVREYE